MTPGTYAQSYASLFTWLWDGDDWVPRRAPILNYLQNGLNPQSANAKAALQKLRRVLPKETGIPGVNLVKTFNFNQYDYINNSIERTFMGKACPWEIQETFQLMSEVGLLPEMKLLNFCSSSVGVDCGGFVANYWGEACPHMSAVAPLGWDGISPRSFWANTALFPDVMSRRRQSIESVKPGDAAIFFKDIKDDNPDIAKQGTYPNLIAGTGSEAFHIGLVEGVGAKSLTICESSGGKKSLGGNGVGVREAAVAKVGKSGKWVYCQMGDNERIYFVAPPWGWGPEEAYNIGDG